MSHIHVPEPLSSKHVPTEPAILLSDVTFSYTAEPILENITMAIQPGDFIALIGPNGGGKTTLLRILLGLLHPQAGTVHIFGAPPETMTSQVGYVPQFSTIRPDFPASVLDVVLMGAAKNSLFGGVWSKSAASKKKAQEYLETLGLADMIHAPLFSLSGGQRQRVLVARALMSRPKENTLPFLLLLDEPTASIDPEGTFCFYEFIGNLRGDVTTVVVSHDLFAASSFFSRVAFINKTATILSENAALTGEDLVKLFGMHTHACPVADLQHAGGLHHPEGCTHQTCSLDK